ncbi:MAG: threonine synthase [Eubacteriales bacterium]|nr:threonine synthase [Eubacteriales bacterium]
MKFRSTRGDEKELNSAQAIIQGIAPDGGLYVPDHIPALPFKVADMVGKPYQDVARGVIGAFFDDYTQEEIDYCVDHAYDEKFDEKDVAPVVKAGDADIIELYHGKTAAFKDMALSILPYLLTTAVKKEKEDAKICILTATSGDTGKAALEGFADVPGTEIIVFYPETGVSDVQKRQMITQQGANTHVFAIKGNFDDAQTGVKNIFADNAFRNELEAKGARLSSANSINIGRLVPQVAYYVWSYIKLVERHEINDGDPINIVVPTGNFGNILAAYYAKNMGIPVNRFICASNKNKVLTDFFATGVYNAKRQFYTTNSPSMDILISSNLERLLYHLNGGNGAEIKGLMGQLRTEGRYEVSPKIKDAMGVFYGGYADVADTDRTIGAMYNDYNYLIDTHTAVAYKVYEDYRKETGDMTRTVLASTASAYKFADSVSLSIGLEEEPNAFDYIEELHKATGVKIPSAMDGLESKPILHTGVIAKTDMERTVEEVLVK